MDTAWKIIATLALVGLNGFFVAAEFAAVGARLSRLEIAAKTNFFARFAIPIKRKLDLYLSTCQLGITIASLGLGATIEPAISSLVAPVLQEWGWSPPQVHTIALAIGLSISTVLHVVVGEVAPKNLAIIYPDKLLPALALPLVIFTYVFYPVIWVLNAASNGILRLVGIKIDKSHDALPHTPEELRMLVAQAVEHGTIEKGNETLLRGAFDFAALKVRQIMTPRTKVDALYLGQPIGQLLKTVQNSSFTRIPLCNGDLDHIVGLIHMKDLFNHLKLTPGKLRLLDEKSPAGEAIAIPDGLPGSTVHVIGSGDIDLQKIRRDILFVPEALALPKLLQSFQNSHVHMAVVVDEHGSTQGIVTLEDVIEQVVGNIEDEFDQEETASQLVADGDNFRVSGQYPLHELYEHIPNLNFESEDVDTVGGYVTQRLNRWPRMGDTVPLGKRHTIKVIAVHQRRVMRVLISPAIDPT